MAENQGTRINKYLSEIGYCSRREGDKLVEKGRVTINGKVPAVGTKISRGDKVAVDGRLISTPEEDFVYLAYNKPVGVVCTTDSSEKDNIVNHVNYPRRIFPIGRLDKPSEGLIFLTNDGDIVNKILRAGNRHEKEYDVTVDKPITAEFIQKMSNGIPVLGTMTRKCEVEKTSKFSFTIVLTQGLNRQIRRMCEYLGYKVKKLKRVRIMNVRLDMPLGQWRELTEKEMSEIQRMVSDSSKTAPEKDQNPDKPTRTKKPKKQTLSSGKPKDQKKKFKAFNKKKKGKKRDSNLKSKSNRKRFK